MCRSFAIASIALLIGLVLGIALGRSLSPFVPATLAFDDCCGDAVSFANPLPSITALDLDRWLRTDEPVVVIDVRQSDKYSALHIPASLSIPLSALVDRANDLNSAQRIVVYGASQVDSALAALELRQFGLSKVRFLGGGIESWKNAGFSVEP